MFLLVVLAILAMVNYACTQALTTYDQEVKQHGKRKAGDVPAQNDQSDERYNMQFSDGKLGGITKFEKVPAGEEQMIKDMAAILQEKMSKDYAGGQTRRDAHPKNLAFLQAEFIVEPNIPEELKVVIFKLPQTYPAWIRISSASGKVQSDKVKDLRGFAIKIMGVQGERYKTQNEEKNTQDFILVSYPSMPLGTVKTKLRRALEELRKQYIERP